MTEMSPHTDDAVQLVPVPGDVPAPDFTALKGFTIAHHYCDEEHRTLFYVARCEMPAQGGKTDKRFIPFTAWQLPCGAREWRHKGLEGLRPLYRLPDLAAHPERAVIVTEGEKCADAVATAFPSVVSTSWSGGAKTHAKTDFSPLGGRDVMFMPDHDEAGAAAIADLTQRLAAQATPPSRIRVLDIARLASCLNMPDIAGFDIADAIHDGLDGPGLRGLIEQHPDLLRTVFKIADIEADDGIPLPPGVSGESIAVLPEGWFRKDGAIYKIEFLKDRAEQHFVASDFYVVGRTRTDSKGPGWGHVIMFADPGGAWQTCILPGVLFAGDGREARELLTARGLVCSGSRKGREALNELIQRSGTAPIFEMATRPGWCGQAFVMPDSIISAGEPRIIADIDDNRHSYGQAGDGEKWRALVGRIEADLFACFMLMTGFAGPLLQLLGDESGGWHVFGPSSRGKTALARLAASVWGSGQDFLKSWNATKNGVEGLLFNSSDTFIVLDEIHQSDVEDILEVIYMLGNGQGKARADRRGRTQEIRSWSTIALSTGESACAARLEAAERRGRGRVTGGAAVRLIDVPFKADLAAVPGFGSGKACAEHIEAEARLHYGFAGPAFVRFLAADLDTARARAKEVQQAFVDAMEDPDDDPQVGRIARRFGLVAAAGTLATEAGILPWSQDTAWNAAGEGFSSWLTARGSTDAEEERDALRQLKGFFEQHGRARFERLPGREDVPDFGAPIIRDRCGYYAHEEGTPVYYVLPESWRTAICADRDPTFVARIARKHGALQTGEDQRLQKKIRLPDYPEGVRVYVIRPDRLP